MNPQLLQAIMQAIGGNNSGAFGSNSYMPDTAQDITNQLNVGTPLLGQPGQMGMQMPQMNDQMGQMMQQMQLGQPNSFGDQAQPMGNPARSSNNANRSYQNASSFMPTPSHQAIMNALMNA
jgi:hypothetical protein